MELNRNLNTLSNICNLFHLLSQLTKKLESATNEVNQQRQELWTLEKQRADLASEVEKYKQDNDFMEGEINTLRSTVNDQMQQVRIDLCLLPLALTLTLHIKTICILVIFLVD